MASNTRKQNDNIEQENESSPFMSFLKYAGLGLLTGATLFAGYQALKLLTAEEVEKLPVSSINTVDGSECPICLEVYKLDDKVKVLNDCKHMYHAKCIKMWIETGPTPNCPMCRRAVKK